MRLPFFPFIFVCAVLASPVSAKPQVETFSPSGTAKSVRQVTARFTTDMVPLGTLVQPDPFVVKCAAKGQGRWIDTRNWSYDFHQDLPAGLRCRFTLRVDQRDLAGKVLTPSEHVFNTGGPAIIESAPFERSRIEEDQVFVLALDGVATPASVVAHTWCRAEGINERIGVRLLEGADREQVLSARKAFVTRFLERHSPLPEANAGASSSTLDTRLFAVVQCRRTLPADVPVTLVWGAGIATPSGVTTDEEQRLTYQTRDDFSASVACERTTATDGCVPFLPVWLNFSAPVPRNQLQGITLHGSDNTRYPMQIASDGYYGEFVSGVSFEGPFQANSSLTLTLPANLTDDAGRQLVNAQSFPLQLSTAPYPPLIKFPARFGILESRGKRMLPVSVRAVESKVTVSVASGGVEGKFLRVDDDQVIDWLRRLSPRDSWDPGEMWHDDMRTPLLESAAGVRHLTLPRSAAATTEVIGIPLPGPGFYVVEVASPLLGATFSDAGAATAYVNAAALVTNMVAHFKRGRHSSLVWVTSLDKGRPVAGAQVSVRGCNGSELWTGKTDAEGIARIGVELVSESCSDEPRFFVSARLGDDMTFTLSDWDRGIEPFRFEVQIGDPAMDDIIAATVFDRTLLRTGETVHMKHFLRSLTGRGVELPEDGNDQRRKGGLDWRAESLELTDLSARPSKAYIVHNGTDEKYELPLAWDPLATSESVWKIPAGAKLGSYDVLIGGRVSGTFRVEQFRVPLMKATLLGPQAPQAAPPALPLDVQLNYLSGGPASFAPVTLRTRMAPSSLHFEKYAKFHFGDGQVHEAKLAVTRRVDEYEWYREDEETAVPPQVRTQQFTLDKAGAARVTVDAIQTFDRPHELEAELSYQDPNGEIQTVSQRIQMWPSALALGIRLEHWLAKQKALRFEAVVLDLAGQPVKGARVSVEFLQRVKTSHRKRVLGGLYAYESRSMVRKLGPACEGDTDQHGLMTCKVTVPAGGNVIVQARTVDGAGRPAYAHVDAWVTGNEEHLFDVGDSDRIDLLPEKKRYEPGERATFQVRSPFRQATALVTVEREGVIDTYIRRLNGKDPSFSIPIKPGYEPNVFVSALLVRGRVAGIAPTALLDLGKPAYKLGITSVKVGWKAHELDVQVSTDRQLYKVREKARVKVKVTRKNGAPLSSGAEIALAAVDTGLLELMPNSSWDLLETMMREHQLYVQTSTAQMQVIGKRHFGRKAIAAGGGGGRSTGRELFDTLLFWKGRIVLDANGEASVDVPLNDSLTSFRIVAIASSGAALFGTGSTEVRSTQDLMLLPGLPQVVREGDRLRAGFTVRNASDRAMVTKLQLSVTADGMARHALPDREITLEAGQAQEIGWDFTVPANARKLLWQAEAISTQARDLVRVTQEVAAQIPVRTLQATLIRLDRPHALPVLMPQGALPGRGGVSVRFTPRLAAAMPGVRAYMSSYPYNCFEQRTSRAVALRDQAMWLANMEALSDHLDSYGLVKYFPTMSSGSETLTAYVLSVADEAGYALPSELRDRMELALTGFIRGKLQPVSELRRADLAVRKVIALEALSRKGPISTDLLGSFDVSPNLWPTAAVIDWYLVLRRSPQLPNRSARMALAERVLRSRLNLQGTTMGFSTESSDDWWWLMMSTDVNASKLLLAMLDNPAWQNDMGRMARGTLGRQRKGRWNTTVANAWGVLAMEKFSAKFENVAVSGAAAARMGQTLQTVALPAAAGQDTVSFAWPDNLRQLGLAHSGKGIPWAIVQSTAAVPLKGALTSGFMIQRIVTPIEQKTKGQWSRGDVYRVRLELEAQSDMTWVVVDDPIPTGATVLGSGLRNDSRIESGGEQQRGWVWAAFNERTNTAYRAYFEYVPKGKWMVEYTVRLNNAGQFTLPSTRVEAMYAPEMFAEMPNGSITVLH